MRFTSLTLWLAAIASSALAFAPTPLGAARGVAAANTQSVRHLTTKLNVASADPISVEDMERGVGGRIEAAFGAAKEKGEAAFVTFITAGYPNKEGEWFVVVSSI